MMIQEVRSSKNRYEMLLASQKKSTLQYLKTHLESLKNENEMSREFNKKAKSLLNGLAAATETKPSRPEVKKSGKYKMAKYQRDYAKHSSYWKQIWLFTPNPVFENGSCSVY